MNDAGLKKEVEFETKLRVLLANYRYSLKDVINLLDPQPGHRAPAVEPKAGSRKPRQLKVYKNPHTGEVVETKGGQSQNAQAMENKARRCDRRVFADKMLLA